MMSNHVKTREWLMDEPFNSDNMSDEFVSVHWLKKTIEKRMRKTQKTLNPLDMNLKKEKETLDWVLSLLNKEIKT